MKKEILLKILIIFCGISLVFLIRIHFNIYDEYMDSTGKNRALFGLTEAFQYGYRYYLGIIPLIGAIISLIFLKNKQVRKYSILSFIISLVTLLFAFFSIWRVFV